MIRKGSAKPVEAVMDLRDRLTQRPEDSLFERLTRTGGLFDDLSFEHLIPGNRREPDLSFEHLIPAETLGPPGTGVVPVPAPRPTPLAEVFTPAGLPMVPALPSMDGIPPVPPPRPGAAVPPAPVAPAPPPGAGGITPLALGIVESLFGGGEPLPPDPFAGEGFGDLAARRGQQFARGATEVAASVPEQLAVAGSMEDTRQAREAAEFRERRAQTIVEIKAKLAETDLNPKVREHLERNLADLEIGQVELQRRADAPIVPAQDRPVFARGDQIREGSKDIFGEPDPRDVGFWAQVAEGGGNMTGMVMASMAANVVGGPVAGLAAGAGIGSSLNVSQVYREAIEAEVDEETALRASKWAAVIGASEILPIARALKLLPPRLRARISGPILGRFADIAQGSGEEAAQEFLATVVYGPDPRERRRR